MQRRVRPMTVADLEGVRALLLQDVAHNALLLGALASDIPVDRWLVGEEDGRMTAVAALGPLAGIAATNPLDIPLLAPELSGHERVKLIVGSDRTLRHLLPLIPASRARRSRCVSRVLESVDGIHFQPARDDNQVIPATAKDAPDILDAVAPVLAAELETPDGPGFRAFIGELVDRAIGQDRMYCVRWKGDILFTLQMVVSTPEVTVLDAASTAAEHRGKGIGRACLGEVCKAVLERSDRVLIAHRHSNPSAEGVARSLGFRPAGEWGTIVLDADPAEDVP